MQINIVKAFLKNQNWQFTEVEDKNVLLFGISGENGKFQCIVDLIEEENQFIFFSVCGANTPTEKKLSMLELLNALNNKQVFGNFEMDLDNGEIRFKTNFVYHNLNINQDFISELIMSNIITMDENLPDIMDLMYGDGDIDAIVERVRLSV